MSDTMLFGILRMPLDMVLSDPLSTAQFHSCAQGAAALIEQQAARIAELEEAIRKQANAARCLADATIRDASIRQELAEKARAESSPEVLASERQANAMLTEENERLTARIAALESASKDAIRREAIEQAAKHMDSRAAEFRGCGNHTADTMARVFEAEADAIRALSQKVGDQQ